MKLLVLLFFSFNLFSQDLLESVININHKNIDKIIEDSRLTPSEAYLLREQVILESYYQVPENYKINRECETNSHESNLEKQDEDRAEKDKEWWEVVLLVETTNFDNPQATENSKRSIDDNHDMYRLSNRIYNELSLTQSEQDFYQKLDQLIEKKGLRSLSLEDQVALSAALINELPYSNQRASFDQDYADKRSTFMQFTNKDESLAGICGDLHKAQNEIIRRINPNLEVYTLSYAMPNGQHVISYVVDPENPRKGFWVNYGRYEGVEVNGAESLTPSSIGSMDDIGQRVRLFMHKNGEQVHIGTFYNQIGSYLYEMATEGFERSSDPLYERSSTISSGFSWGKQKTKTKTKLIDGISTDITKIVDINQKLKAFHGNLEDGTQVSGLMYKYSANKNLNPYNGVLLDGEKSGRISYFSMINAQVDFNRMSHQFGIDAYDDQKMTKLYLVGGQKYVREIFAKDGFQFGGHLGYELEADFTSGSLNRVTNSSEMLLEGFVPEIDSNSRLNTGDGNFKSNAGVYIMKESERSNILLTSSLTHHIGLSNQPQYVDFSEYPQILRMTPTALDNNLNYRLKTAKGDLMAISRWIATSAGGQSSVSIGFVPKESFAANIYLSYSTPTNGFSSRQLNLIPYNYQRVNFGMSSKDLLKKSADVDLRFNTSVDIALKPDEVPINVLPVFIQGGVRMDFNKKRSRK